MNYERICKELDQQIHQYVFLHKIMPNQIILGKRAYNIMKLGNQKVIKHVEPIHTYADIKVTVDEDRPDLIAVGYMEISKSSI